MTTPDEHQTFGDWLKHSPEGAELIKRSRLVSMIYKWCRRAVGLALLSVLGAAVAVLLRRWDWALDGAILTACLVIVRLMLGRLASIIWRKNQVILERLANS